MFSCTTIFRPFAACRWSCIAVGSAPENHSHPKASSKFLIDRSLSRNACISSVGSIRAVYLSIPVLLKEGYDAGKASSPLGCVPLCSSIKISKENYRYRLETVIRVVKLF